MTVQAAITAAKAMTGGRVYILVKPGEYRELVCIDGSVPITLYGADTDATKVKIAYNNYTKFTIWAAKHSHGTQSVADLVKSPGFNDPREPERWNPKLKLIKEILLTQEPEVAQFRTALRIYNRLLATSTALSRMGTVVLHFRF